MKKKNSDGNATADSPVADDSRVSEAVEVPVEARSGEDGPLIAC